MPLDSPLAPSRACPELDAGGVYGRGCQYIKRTSIQPKIHLLLDCFNYLFKIFINLFIAKSQKEHSIPLKPYLSSTIFKYLVVMISSINLNDKHDFMAVKVYNKMIHRHLPVKLYLQFSLADRFPKLLFLRGRIVS